MVEFYWLIYKLIMLLLMLLFILCVSVYARNNKGAKINFMDNLENFISSYASTTDNILIGGDFNACLNKNDRYPPIDKISKNTEALNSFLQQLMLKDCWQVSNQM